MADSEQDKQVNSNFDDDLDKMLQDTTEQSDQPVEDEFSENVDDLVDSLLESVATEQDSKVDTSDEVLDEFADNPIESEITNTAADDLLDKEENIDTIQSSAKPVTNTTESMTEIDEFSADSETEDDFLLADFDISADDDDFAAEGQDMSATEQKPSVVAVDEPEIPVKEVAESIPPKLDNLVAKHDDQSERIDRIESELAELKSEANFSDALDKVVKQQKKANRALDEANKKLKIWAISALVIGVIALIIGGTVLIFNFGLQSNIEQVQGGVMDIEDQLAVPAIKLVDPNDAKIESLQLSVRSMQSIISKLPERLNDLQGQMNAINTEKIQLVVDKQVLDMNEKISALEAKLARLKTVKTKRKAISKRIVVKNWAVNLVSFKQRWYTDQKVKEFKQKGIPVEVIPVDVRGVEWFRVRVVGFKNKAKAMAYAAKMKKLLNLNSVWVSAK